MNIIQLALQAENERMNDSDSFFSHIALPLNVAEDIVGFYSEILGFTEQYRFEISDAIADIIFGIHKPIVVTVVENNGLQLELFLIEGAGIVHNISHFCLNVPDVYSICEMAKESGYSAEVIERPSGKIAFLKDLSGNLVEIKENSIH